MNYEIFKNKKFDVKKLLSFGFKKQKGGYFYTRNFSDNQFLIKVFVAEPNVISTEVIDISAQEPYTLHLVEGAKGSFVCKIKKEYENILGELAKK